MYCVILPRTKVFFIFVNSQKVTSTLNLLTNPICEIYVFYFGYPTVNFFPLVNKYLLTYFKTTFSISKYAANLAFDVSSLKDQSKRLYIRQINHVIVLLKSRDSSFFTLRLKNLINHCPASKIIFYFSFQV